MRNIFSEGLRKLIHPETTLPKGPKEAKVIAIATVKGGVGKTTTAVNLATTLAQTHGKKILLIDLDAQGHCSTSLKAHLPAHPVALPLSEVLLEDSKQVMECAVVCTMEEEDSNLSLTLADQELADAEGRIAQKIGKEMLLRDALEITRTHYDVILIDCPPNKGNLTLNALVAADAVLIPTDLSPLALQGAEELMGTVMTVQSRLSHPLHILGVLLTKVDARTSALNDSLRGQVKEAWGEMLFDTEIRINTKLADAQLQGRPVLYSAPRSRGAKDYEALGAEVLKKLESL